MKKMNLKLTSITLVLAIMFSLSAPVFGASTSGETCVDSFNCNGVNLKITEENIKDITILRQYEDNVLVAQVYINDNFGTLQIDSFDSNGEVVNTQQIDVQPIARGPMSFQIAANGTDLGTAKYSTSEGLKYIDVAYTTRVYSNSTFNIDRQTTTLVGLAGIAVSALGVTAAVGTLIVKWVLGIMGIAISTGSFLFPGRVLSCRQTDYTYNLTDSDFVSHTNSFVSSKYVITDDREQYATNKGSTYYEGWEPSQAKNDVSFAQTCFSYMFDGISYAFIDWI